MIQTALTRRGDVAVSSVEAQKGPSFVEVEQIHLASRCRTDLRSGKSNFFAVVQLMSSSGCLRSTLAPNRLDHFL